MTDEWIKKALALFVVADAAWARAALVHTDAADRRAARAQQALQDHLSEEGWHWERFEAAVFEALRQVPA